MKGHYFTVEQRENLGLEAAEIETRLALRRRHRLINPLNEEEFIADPSLLKGKNMRGILWLAHKTGGFSLIVKYIGRMATAIGALNLDSKEFIDFVQELRKERKCKPFFSEAFLPQLSYFTKDDYSEGIDRFIRKSLDNYNFSDLYTKSILIRILEAMQTNPAKKDFYYSLLKFLLEKAPKETIERFENHILSIIEKRDFYPSKCSTGLRQLPYSSMNERRISSMLKTRVRPAFYNTFDRFIDKKTASYMINRISKRTLTGELADQILDLVREDDWAEVAIHCKTKTIIQEKVLLGMLGGDNK